MKKLIALGAGVVGAASVSMALFGVGVASADDYAGMSYDDAASAAGDAGESVHIASRVGSLPDSDCTVQRSQMASYLDGSDFITRREGEVEFYLNCTAGVAGPGVPGNSLQSEAGRAARAAAEEEAAQQQSEAEELLQAGEEPGATTPDIATG